MRILSKVNCLLAEVKKFIMKTIVTRMIGLSSGNESFSFFMNKTSKKGSCKIIR